jgi:hypothetical protein
MNGYDLLSIHIIKNSGKRIGLPTSVSEGRVGKSPLVDALWGKPWDE